MSALAHQQSDTDYLDTARLDELSEVLGEETTAELIDQLSSELPDLLLQMKAAVTAGNTEEARHAAHQLKGVASNGAAMRVATEAQTFEDPATTIETMQARLAELETLVENSVDAYAALKQGG